MFFICPQCQLSYSANVAEGETVACTQCGTVLTASSSPLTDMPATQSMRSPKSVFVAPPGARAATLQPVAVPHQIGKFTILGLVNEGGHGRVYRARDTRTDRVVALKVPRRDTFSSDVAFGEFMHEATTSVRLDSIDGIIPVYEADRSAEGVVYIAMKYIDGWTLTHFLTAEGLQEASVPDFVDWLAQVAVALAHAHAKEIRHRDLKPGNIMIERQSRRAWVGDFGLAVQEEDQRLLPYELAGTFGYMSPEQVRGERSQLDGRTDVWSLGVILYERLARRRPFTGKAGGEIFDQILTRPAIPPSQFCPDGQVPKRLEEICLRCLQREPALRYPNMQAVADELRTWLIEEGDCFQTPNAASGRSANPSSLGFPTVQPPSTRRTPRTVVEETVTPLARPVTATARRSPRVVLTSAMVLLMTIGALPTWMLFSSMGKPSAEPSGWTTPKSRRPSPLIYNLDDLSRPGVGYNLLERRPQILSWPDPATEAVPATEQFLAEDGLYSISSNGLTFMACGATAAKSFRFGINVSQRSWTGKCGILWGGHQEVDEEGTPHLLIQGLWLKDFRQRIQPELRGYYLVREQFNFRLAGEEWQMCELHEFVQERIPDPLPGSHRLEIVVSQGAVAEVTWDDKPMEDVTDAGLLHWNKDSRFVTEGHARLNTAGTLGLLSGESTSDFFRATFRRH